MRFQRHEARTVLALARWIGRRVPAGFTYHRGMRRMVELLAIGVLVEGVIVDLLLAAILPARRGRGALSLSSGPPPGHRGARYDGGSGHLVW